MRLLRLLATIAALGAMSYVAAKVPLGGKTLVEHARAIAGTEESRELVDGVKRKAGELMTQDAGTPAPHVRRTGDDLTEDERRLLRRLIQEKLAASGAKQAGAGAGPKQASAGAGAKQASAGAGAKQASAGAGAKQASAGAERTPPATD